MSDDGKEVKGRTGFDLSYRGQSGFVDEADAGRVNLFADTHRADVGFKGKVKDPLQMREILATLYEIVKSDFRYVPKDRSAYLTWKTNNKKGVGKSAFQAQKEYFEWLRQNDPHAWLILDPIVTANPDKLIFEVFSKDEGTYGRLDIDWEALELEGKPKYGTTNVDFSKALADGVQQMRAHRDTVIAMSDEAFGLKTDDADEVIEKHIEVPNSWLRGFLQVQSAATLGGAEFEISAMDFYNVLRTLRMNGDQKGKGRAIRAELTPGQPPRLVLEPWELVIEADGDVYRGDTAEVLRFWGRRRLMTLKRLLPYVEKVRVRMLGNGMPSFWTIECGLFRVTIGLTGFVASNWSQAVHMDVMLPAMDLSDAAKPAIEFLKKNWSASIAEIAKATKSKEPAAVAAMQFACRTGIAMYDHTDGVYRYRPVAAEALEPEMLQFRNPREREAHDLLDGHAGSVELTGENEITGRGVEFTAKVDVKADQREYETKFQLTPDGRLYRPDCTCTFFKKHQLKEGPCPHLLALRFLVARKRLEDQANRGGKKISAETRTYVRRDKVGEQVYLLTLDNKQVRTDWGLRTDQNRRFQRMMFNGVDDARDAYLAKIADLEAKGFMDATE